MAELQALLKPRAKRQIDYVSKGYELDCWMHILYR